MKNKDESLHWLVRPTTIQKLWIGFSVVLALVVLAQAVIYVKGYFRIDGWFGFGAVYGFVCCLLMVLAAKLLGVVLKRPQGYYDVAGERQETDPGQKETGPGQSRVEDRTDGA